MKNKIVLLISLSLLVAFSMAFASLPEEACWQRG